MCVLMFVNVVLRYVFKSGIVWADEICRYSFVITAFLGISYCLRKRNIMQMDSIKKALPFKARFVVEIFVDLLLATYFVYFSVSAVSTIQKGIKMGSETEVLRIPLYIIYIIVLVCYILAALRALQKAVADGVVLSKGKEAFDIAEKARLEALYDDYKGGDSA